MRVCFLSRRYFPSVSGMSVYADNLVRQLVRLGHGVTMLSQYYGGEAAGVYGGGPPPPIDGATVIGVESVGEQSRGDFEADIETLANRVEREHRRAPFDLVHAQYGYPTGYAALVAARRIGLPCVVSIQGGDGHWVGECCATHKRAMRLVCGRADALIIGSDSFAEEVSARLGTDPSRFTVIPGAVDTERFHPKFARELGDVSEPPRLLYHGRVDRRKGVLELLDAYERLRRGGRNLALQISGIGPDLEEVRRRAAGVEGVRVTGHADYVDAPTVYRGGDVFVSPTHAEGFSNTILEAMASGLPIVSCRAVGVVDCLAHERDALLAEVGDAGDLTRQIARLLDDAPLRRRLAQTALEEVRSLYAWPAVARQIVGVYDRVVAGPRDDDFAPMTGGPDPCRFRAEPHLL